MDREAGTKRMAALGCAGAKTCGGVMVRGPKSGNGTRSPVYYLDSAGLVPPRSRARALYSQADPLGAGMLADGSLAADPGIADSWRGAGGRWLLWPLRVVLLLALVNGQLMQLGVPIAASGTGVVVSGEPAWPSAPPQISPPPAAPGSSDQVARSQLMNQLPAFFQAYASGSVTLNRFAVRGVSLTGLGGAVTFDAIGALHVPPGGATRQITVTVIWQLPERSGSNTFGSLGTSELAVTYRMSVVDLQGGKWYVKEIGASTEAVGAR